jgi:hypothetical protein
MRRSVVAQTLIAGLLVAACSSAAAPTPQVIYVTPAPSALAPANAAPTPTPTATSSQYPIPSREVQTPVLTPEPTPEITPEPTPEITPKPTPKPTPVSYVALTSRAWALLVKAPDNYTGKAYKVYGCITQFDAATGTEQFRAQASYQNEDYWYTNGANALFSGVESKLADYVEGDIVSMKVMSLGSYSYDTQNGGNTTVPLFMVVSIARLPGSC